MRVLIIEDDTETADYVLDGLRRNGHIADQVSDGRDGLMSAAGGDYDVIVVDRMLPGSRWSGNRENDSQRRR